MRVAVVTPYHGEPAETLWRCHASVLAQSIPVEHIFVADGRPTAAIEGWNAQHVVLPYAHGDGGDTPRGLGALTALNQGFDAVAFLDADNWFAADHIETGLRTCLEQKVDVSFSFRQIVLSTGEFCTYEDLDVVERRHVDTSCYFMMKTAAATIALWAMIDPKVWQACDRIMFNAIKTKGVPHAWTGHKSVYYTSKWGLHFRAMGLEPPADEHHIDWSDVAARYDPAALGARFGFDPQVALSETDHFAPNESNPLDYLNRIAMSGPVPQINRDQRSKTGVG